MTSLSAVALPHVDAPAEAAGLRASLAPADQALLDLLKGLAEARYSFTTPAPLSHRRLLLRRRGPGVSLADIFGLNMAFEAASLDPALLEAMAAGGVLERRGSRLKSTLRVASVGEQLFLHSGFPVRDKAHVFFGPDSYRFADFLGAELGTLPAGARILDIGAGAGVGGLVAAAHASRTRLILADINPDALRLARINAAFAGMTPGLRHWDGVPPGDGPFDLVVANPPYILGSGLTYSDGGRRLGAEITLRWATAALQHLAPGGRVLLYSGSAIVRGQDALGAELLQTAAAAGCGFAYREIDPDVFPTTLLQPRYWRVERIAAIGAVFTKPG